MDSLLNKTPIYISILTLCGLAILFCLLMLIRNEQAYNEQMRLIKIIFSKDNYEEILIDYHKISYTLMVILFWRPVKSFYKPLIEKYHLEEN